MNPTRKQRATTLRDAQIWMVSAITGSEVDALQPERFVTAGPRMNASARLDVYRSGYRSRLVECLRDDYPVLAKMLGEERFDALAHGTIARYPSSSPNLNAFGRSLARFCLECDPGVLGEQRSFAAELASLEWSVVEVLHAEASAALDVSALQSSPPEHWASARFVASDAVRLHRFEYPVNAYYQACLEHDEVAALPLPLPSATLVYRKDERIWRMDLTAIMVRVLSPMLAGERMGDALGSIESSASAPHELDDLGRNLSVWFREWARAGIFARIE